MGILKTLEYTVMKEREKKHVQGKKQRFTVLQSYEELL